MKAYRDTAAIRGAVTSLPDISTFLAKRLEELSEYTDHDLSELLNVFVIESGDTLAAIDAELGISATETPTELIEAHPGWYEVTYLLGDDGFGLVVYVPNTGGIEPRLLQLCADHATHGSS